MAYAVVCLASLLAAALTFFSGFGLGTLLMPAFALFFPLEVAVAATAIVHLANNLFQLAVVGRHASPGVVARFALPAIPMALLGAWVLTRLSHIEPLARYELAGRTFRLWPVGVLLGAVITAFAILELWPRFARLAFPPRLLPLGGAISGFFGGLSGHQGALRAAFLIRAGLSKEEFVGTSVVCSVLVDCARLLVYGLAFFAKDWAVLQGQGGLGLVAAASASAFAGTFLAGRLLAKVTLRGVRLAVGVMLLVVGIALGAGLI